jgi:hypothetical protein
VGFSNHYRVLALGPAVVYGVAVRYLVDVGGETFPLERTATLEGTLGVGEVRPPS